MNKETSRLSRLKLSPRTRHWLLWVWGILCFLLAVCTIAAAYAGAVDPSVTALPAMLALTFPAWIILTVVMLIATLFFSWKLALIPGATLLICLGPIVNNVPVNFVKQKLTPEEKARTFTLLSYNTMGLQDTREGAPMPYTPGEDRSPVNPTLSYILSTDADILCLQEFPKTLAPIYRLRITQEQVDSLNANYPYHCSNYSETIYSKYPLYPIDLKRPREEYQPYQAAVLSVMGRKMLLVSVHLESFGLNDSDKALYREVTDVGRDTSHKLRTARHVLMPKLSRTFQAHAEQALELRQLIDSLNINNVIVAGDFNDVPDCYAIRRISGKDFRNAFSIAGHGPMITFHTNRFYFHIDHVLYRGALEAIDFRLGHAKASDHYPVITTFMWNPKSQPDSVGMPRIDLLNNR